MGLATQKFLYTLYKTPNSNCFRLFFRCRSEAQIPHLDPTVLNGPTTTASADFPYNIIIE
jgi:hypothetical protein